MHIKDHFIVGVHINQRTENAVKVQQILSEYGCNIKTRIGLHEIDENYCAGDGVVLLEMVGETEKVEAMLDQLQKIKGVEAKNMIFSHE